VIERPPLPDIARQAGERETLIAFLDNFRADLLDRAWGLDDEQLRQMHGPTTLNLARLLSHMAWVEQHWFRGRFDGEQLGEPWASLDWEADPDAEMSLGETWTGEQLRAQFEASVADSRRRVAAATSLDQVSVQPHCDGDHWNLRWVLVHMIEEYARHCGHADLIRESIDGDIAQ